MSTVRCTMAQALVRYLCNQFTIIDGKQEMLFPGVFAIFGHGNVTCLSEALEAVKDTLPTWRGQNEQSMALAAIGFAKAKRRRQIMVATSSIGPGALNMVTAAGVAHSNRLPVLLLSGDTFVNRRPDPVMQQVEHFGDPSINVNDAFRAVTRYWDRLTHPEQIISSLPQAVAVLLDPGDCGPAFIALPQDIQEIAWDYPGSFFKPTFHATPRPRADKDRLAQALDILKSAKRPLIISGGGVRYSGAEDVLGALAIAHGIPTVAETIAGKGTLTHHHPAHVRPDRHCPARPRPMLWPAEADVMPAYRHAPDGFHHRFLDLLLTGREIHLDQCRAALTRPSIRLPRGRRRCASVETLARTRQLRMKGWKVGRHLDQEGSRANPSSPNGTPLSTASRSRPTVRFRPMPRCLEWSILTPASATTSSPPPAACPAK